MKRRLSASESASSTPVPGDALASVAALLPAEPSASASASVSVSARVSPDASPRDPGSRAASASATPAPKTERTIAKPGVIVPGSGDGTAYGDECFLWTDLPMNKTGYRYAPCAPSPTVSPAPHFPFYRTIAGAPPAPPVALSWVDRSAFLRVSKDAMTATTDRGYRSGRASVAVREGTWYYEAIVERGDAAGGGGRGTGGDTGNPHVRIGWGRREAGLDAPVGADAYSYAIRDVGGEKVHISRPKPYGRSFGTGDVVGCLIHLPRREEVENEEEPGYVRRWRIPLRYKGQLYFEMDEYPVSKEMEALVNREGRPVAHDDEPKKKSGAGGVKKAAVAETTAERPVSRSLTTLDGSYISFYLNGEPLGTAFEDLYDFLPLPPLPGFKKKYSHAYDREREAYQYHDDGTLGYFPMISCFGRGKVRVNFGPTWSKPPADVAAAGARPLCDRWPEFRAQEQVYDERDEVTLAEKLVKDMAAAAEAKAKARAKAEARAQAPLKRKDKKRKKETTGTPGPDTPVDTPRGDRGETPRGEHTPFETPASSPPRSSPRARSTPLDDRPYARETQYGHLDAEPALKIEREEHMDAHGDTDADADGEDEDANAGVAWS